MTAILFSDVHLKDANSVKTSLVIRFLQEVASQYDRIYILGDFFDVWPVTTGFLARKFRPVIAVLKGLVHDGHEIHYFEGNHDFHLGDYFTDMGVRVYPNFSAQCWEGKRVYLAHGDLGNPKDFAYLALRRFLRVPLTRGVLQFTPQEWLFQVGMKSSQWSHDYQLKRGRNECLIRQVYRRSAERFFQQGYDIVVMGHTHLPDDFVTTVEGRPRRYLNTGDWVKHFTYLEFDGANFYTKTHPLKRF